MYAHSCLSHSPRVRNQLPPINHQAAKQPSNLFPCFFVVDILPGLKARGFLLLSGARLHPSRFGGFLTRRLYIRRR